jgi:N-acyl homoserine lactone hydrolase
MNKQISLLCLIVILVITIFFILLNSIPYKIKPFNRNIFSNDTINIESKENSNKDFLKSSSSITVKLIHSGNLKVPLSKTINLKSPSCSGIDDKELTVPIFAYLIHHERYGYFLIDSGCDSSYISNHFGPMKGIILPFVMAETSLEPDGAIEKQLSDIRNDIKGVFFTHLHFDHTSGLRALQDNIIYIAGKGEKSFSIKGLLEPNHFKKNDTVNMLDFDSAEAQMLPIGKAIDIFGDQSLWAISTSGHSKGHVSYIVNTKDHPILITGDACILNKSIEIGVGPGTSSENIEQAQETFNKILSFTKDNPNVEVWPGHDFPK